VENDPPCYNIKIWKAVACTVTKFSDFKRTGIFPLAEWLLATQ